MKRDIEQLKEKNDSLDAIVATIRSASQSELCGIVTRVREHGSLADIVRSIKDKTTVTDGDAQSGSEPDLSEIVERFRTGDSRHSSIYWSGPSLDDGVSVSESREYSGSWTRVTSDVEFISDLLVGFTLFFFSSE